MGAKEMSDLFNETTMPKFEGEDNKWYEELRKEIIEKMEEIKYETIKNPHDYDHYYELLMEDVPRKEYYLEDLVKALTRTNSFNKYNGGSLNTMQALYFNALINKTIKEGEVLVIDDKLPHIPLIGFYLKGTIIVGYSEWPAHLLSDELGYKAKGDIIVMEDYPGIVGRELDGGSIVIKGSVGGGLESNFENARISGTIGENAKEGLIIIKKNVYFGEGSEGKGIVGDGAEEGVRILIGGKVREAGKNNNGAYIEVGEVEESLGESQKAGTTIAWKSRGMDLYLGERLQGGIVELINREPEPVLKHGDLNYELVFHGGRKIESPSITIGYSASEGTINIKNGRTLNIRIAKASDSGLEINVTADLIKAYIEEMTERNKITINGDLISPVIERILSGEVIINGDIIGEPTIRVAKEGDWYRDGSLHVNGSVPSNIDLSEIRGPKAIQPIYYNGKPIPRMTLGKLIRKLF